MAKIFNGMIPFASAIQPTGAQPLDDRVVVATLADLTDATTFGDAKYNGMLVAVTETQQVYMLVDDVNSTSSDAWVQVGKETDLTDITDKLNIGNNSGLTFDDQGALSVKLVPNTDNYVNGITSTADGLKVATYNLKARSTSDDNYAAQYDFTVDGVTITTINIPKDQFLKEATFVASATDADQAIDSTVIIGDPYLKFVWQIDTDPEVTGLPTTYVAVKSLVDTYTAGDYIDIVDNKISVNAGIFSEIKDQIGLTDITTDITSLKSTVGDSNSGLVADVAKNTSDISGINDSITTISGDVTNLGTDLSTFKSNVKVTDIDDTASHGVSLGFTEAVEGETSSTIKVNVDLEALRADLSVNADAVLTTADIKDNEDDVDARYEQGTSVQSILANLNARINEIDSDIQGALAGGVTNVGAGNGISVDSSTATKPVVSVKVVAGSALKATTDGLDIYWTEI